MRLLPICVLVLLSIAITSCGKGEADPAPTVHRLSSSAGASSSTSVTIASSWSSPNSSAAAVDNSQVSLDQQVIQQTCVLCHTDSGAAAASKLIFKLGSEALTANITALKKYVLSEPDAAVTLLYKVTGRQAHGGGRVYSQNSAEFTQLQNYITRFLPGVINIDIAVQTQQQTRLEDASFTLRRAARILARRFPSAAEMQLANRGETGLSAAIDALLKGEGFHRFLIEAANSQLHTDAYINGLYFEHVSPLNPYYPALAQRKYEAFAAGGKAIDDYHSWYRDFRFGVARAPLELIAQVVENDLPYSEILTASYTMVNPQANQILRGDALFDSDDRRVFKVNKNRGYVVKDQAMQWQLVSGIGVLVSSHGDYINFPHAGILTDPAFLNRYPTTDTNRNRTRAKVVHRLFLGQDLQDFGARQLDADALSDSNNPTLNNPNCTGCHGTLDPIAGAFQNFGRYGWYRESFRGLDALPGTYKNQQNSPYVLGDIWFRDMRAPGFYGKPLIRSHGTVQELAERIVADQRFAKATVTFWWGAIMPAMEAKESATAEMEQTLAAAKNSLIDRLAQEFLQGNQHTSAFNLKQLIKSMILSDAFRAIPVSGSVRAEQLLSPGELQSKVRDVLGFVWGDGVKPLGIRDEAGWLVNQYAVYFGGIDSINVTEPLHTINSVMTNVIQAQALAVACPAVLLDFSKDVSQRGIFTELEPLLTPDLEFQQWVDLGIGGNKDVMLTANLSAGDNKYLALTAAFNGEEVTAIRGIEIRGPDGDTVLSVVGGELTESPAIWISEFVPGLSSAHAVELEGVRGMVLNSGVIKIPFQANKAGNYQVTISSTQLTSPGYPYQLRVSVHDGSDGFAGLGTTKIRQQLRSLHRLFLAEQSDSAEDEIAYSLTLLKHLWLAKKSDRVLTDLVDNYYQRCEIPNTEQFKLVREQTDLDVFNMRRVWVAMMVYFLSDYKFIYE